jgi:hypothetical protein
LILGIEKQIGWIRNPSKAISGAIEGQSSGKKIKSIYSLDRATGVLHSEKARMNHELAVGKLNPSSTHFRNFDDVTISVMTIISSNRNVRN